MQHVSLSYNSRVFIHPSIHPTFLFGAEPLVAPEQQDERPSLHQLEGDVDHGEEEEWAHHFRCKRHFQNSGTQLDVLTACFHGDSPSLPEEAKTCSQLIHKERLMII